MNYLRLSDDWKRRFGGKVYKLSLQSGCSCPNRDGRLSYGGCSFCSEGGSGDFAAPLLPIREQLEIAKKRVEAKLPKSEKEGQHRYIAYFQSYTNTYGPEERLGELFREAMAPPEIVALSIGTRPDCISPRMLEILTELNREKPVYVELGLQTIHEDTASRINRGYALPVFEDCYRRLKAAGLMVVVHVILGLPGENEDRMLATVRYLSALTPAPDGIKLQLLHVLQGTRLAAEYMEKPFHILTLEEYSRLIVKCLKLLPPEVVVHRITGDGPKRLLLAPLWSADKKRVLNTLQKAIAEA